MEAFRAKPGKAGIILAGGASKSSVWAQMVADICGLPVRISATPDLACVGAAVLAGVGCGIFADRKEGFRCLAAEEHTLYPDPKAAEAYEQLFTKYKNLANYLQATGKEG